MADRTSLEMRSLISKNGELRVWLGQAVVASPEADEVVVRVEAAPINPADLLVLFGPADLKTLRRSDVDGLPGIVAQVPRERMQAVAARLDMPLPVGNEGAGIVIDAGRDAQHLLGQTVALRDSMYSQFRLAKASDLFVMPKGTAPAAAASACINPMTALGMVETMRREGHTALVHTAAASNVGQMLARICAADGIPLVNIVRNKRDVDLLRSLGSQFVLDSSSDDFEESLREVIFQTGATLAFDAIGGGTMAARLLAAMEHAASRRATGYSRYGSSIHKQVYIYGVLDPSPKVIEGNIGSAWGVGGWLLTWFQQRIGEAELLRLRQRVAAELSTTFSSVYGARYSLAQALSPETIANYARPATGHKVLLTPFSEG